MRMIFRVRYLPAILAAGLALPAMAEDAGVTLPPAAPETAALPAGPSLLPEAAAFKAALQTELAPLDATERAAIDGFFAARLYAPFWTDAGTRREPELVAALAAADAQALPVDRYDPDGLAALFEAGAAAPATLEVAASRAFLAFGHDVAGGIVRPDSVAPEYVDRTPVRPAPSALMNRLATEPVADILRSLEPKAPDYALLKAEKARLEDLARTASWGPEVADGPTLHPGDSDPRVAGLRARLARLGYLQPTAEAASSAFDDGLADAVAAFQRDYGLNDDGVVGALTLDAVNAPAETRLAQVAVNLERMRWMPKDLGARYLWVNIPDFTVRLMEDGKETWQSRAVVGKTAVTETPEFDGLVRTVVINPTWHIPDSIAIRDYLPKLQKNPMVLKNAGIDLMTRGGTVINPNLVDFTQYTPENFPFRIKQRPSDDNALGQVKFLFPNHFSVYMHDTPHRDLFARDVRAYSNGCIRLQKPVELAHILLTGQVADPVAAFDAWRDSGKEKGVTLERPIPVHIVYRTAFFDESGAVHFRPDVYGRDATVFAMMQKAGVVLPAAQG
ncbi:MAG: L,D-transpeptidase family protein [Amaricoccus sp.]|uniref:L,D-transpeptidase family protein n=1 Tax=Amaricoccus sp. TaxID=1872485 RepID=UPI0039E58864